VGVGELPKPNELKALVVGASTLGSELGNFVVLGADCLTGSCTGLFSEVSSLTINKSFNPIFYLFLYVEYKGMINFLIMQIFLEFFLCVLLK
jgi:hypothetical protein